MTSNPPADGPDPADDVPLVRQVVLDCPHPRTLAEFYRRLLAYEYRPGDEQPPDGDPDQLGDDWLVLRPRGVDETAGRGLAFQRTDPYEPPVWHAGEVPTSRQLQMLHLDLSVPDVAALSRQRARALALGATQLFDRTDDEEEPCTSSPTPPATRSASSSGDVPATLDTRARPDDDRPRDERPGGTRARHPHRPNLRVDDVDRAKGFYTGFLGLSTEEFSLGWVARYTSPESGANVQLVSRDATAPEDSVVSVVTDDVDAAHDEAVRLGYEIVHPLTTESWGVRRFFVRAPDGNVVNVVGHPA